MCRFRWMLPLILVIAASIPLRVVSAQEPAPKAEAPSGMGMGGMGMGGYMPGEHVLLMLSNSPLRFEELRAGGDSGFDQLSLLAGVPMPSKYMVHLAPLSSTRSGSVIAVLSVASFESPPAEETKKLVALAEKRLEETLLKIHNANMDSLHERLRRAEQRLAEARDAAEKRQSDVQSLRTRLVQFDASPEGIDQQQKTLRQDRLKLRVELVGLKARREAIVKAVAEASDKLKAITDEQQRELAELAKIVDLRGQQLARAKELAKRHAVSVSDVEQAELDVSKAKADLAERRRLIAQQAGSDQLSRLNQQLADVQIEMAAAEARVADIEAMLHRLQSKEVLELLAQYGQATQQVEYARAEEKAAFEQLAEAKKTAESTPAPKVVEIRGPAAPK